MLAITMLFKALFAVILFTASLVAAQDVTLQQVEVEFHDAKIPADTHFTFHPTKRLQIRFLESSGPSIDIEGGAPLHRNQTAIPPLFGLHDPSLSDLTQTFVVAMIDLDAPTPQNPTRAQIRHFLGGNFRLDSASDTTGDGFYRFSNSTPAISEYRQPTPPAGSDPHRYVFLLFRQPSNFNDQTSVTSTTSTSNFNLSAFASEVGLGDPLGGSFILVGPDPPAA